MSMPIQRQSDQFSVFDTSTRWERDRPSHDLPKGLAGLVNSMGRSISAGMLNTRTASSDCEYCGEPGHDWQVHPEAHRDVAEWEREKHLQEFPFGDYTEGMYPSEDDHGGEHWPGKTAGWHTPDYDPRVDGYPEEDSRRPSRAEAEADEARGGLGEGDDEDEYDIVGHDPDRFIPENFMDYPDRTARRGSGRLPFDPASGREAGLILDEPDFDRDPTDIFNTRARRGTCTACGRPRSEPSCAQMSHGDYRGPRYRGEPQEDYEAFYREHYAAAAPAPAVPGAHSYLPGHLVQSVWRGNPIPGIVTGLDGTRVWVRYQDGQHLSEEPQDIQPR